MPRTGFENATRRVPPAMSAVCPFPAAFTVFAGDGSRESLLIVSLDDSCALTCPDPLVRPRFTLNDWTQHHLPIRAICDAIALLFGCLDLSTASEYAIATDCLRYKIFDIQSDGYIGSAMDDEALQKHVTPGSGVFFQLSTYDGALILCAVHRIFSPWNDCRKNRPVRRRGPWRRTKKMHGRVRGCRLAPGSRPGTYSCLMSYHMSSKEVFS